MPKRTRPPAGRTDRTSAFFDDEILEQRVIDLTLAAERQPLLTATAPAGPAFYLLFAQPTHTPTAGWDILLGPFSRGLRPLYAGAALNMGSRLCRYRSSQSLGGARGVPVERIWIAIVPTRTHAGSLFGEAVWLPSVPWARRELAGAGSRVQGSPRKTQRVQPWARLWPREWDGIPTPTAVAATRLAMAARAVEPPPPGPTWPPLPVAGGPGSHPVRIGVADGALDDAVDHVAKPLLQEAGQGPLVRLDGARRSRRQPVRR